MLNAKNVLATLPVRKNPRFGLSEGVSIDQIMIKFFVEKSGGKLKSFSCFRGVRDGNKYFFIRKYQKNSGNTGKYHEILRNTRKYKAKNMKY
jgi:hypothetical protein